MSSVLRYERRRIRWTFLRVLFLGMIGRIRKGSSVDGFSLILTGSNRHRGAATSYRQRNSFQIASIPERNEVNVVHPAANGSADASETDPVSQFRATTEAAAITSLLEPLQNVTFSGATSIFPASPPLSFKKYMTMQDKRVVVTVRYSEEESMKPYFLTVVQKIKAMHPDVIVERRGVVDAAAISNGGNNSDGGADKSSSSSSSKSTSIDDTFEILVDGKPVVVAGGNKHKNSGQTVARGMDTIFVSMSELTHAIERARKRRRPSTTYGAGGGPSSLTTTSLRPNTKRS